jgi:NADPH-dependent 2,4-dienoyl-CoA reductase/sulfur reductase-like enzyme
VKSIDLERRVVTASHCLICGSREFPFDHLVLALGSTTEFHGLPGVAENALPMKTLGDAMALRNHIIDVFEHADMVGDPILRESMLTFVVAGGGFAGTETVAEVHDFAQTACRFYSTIKPSEIKVVLIHSGTRIMPEIGDRLAEYALKKLEASGIEVVLNAQVSSASDAWVELTGKPLVGKNVAQRTQRRRIARSRARDRRSGHRRRNPGGVGRQDGLPGGRRRLTPPVGTAWVRRNELGTALDDQAHLAAIRAGIGGPGHREC